MDEAANHWLISSGVGQRHSTIGQRRRSWVEHHLLFDGLLKYQPKKWHAAETEKDVNQFGCMKVRRRCPPVPLALICQ
ncbi:hypothetical protein U8C33_37965 (plasmid) [Sinorhizobium meliloti]|nr:hypothetical protein U8C33_37965 [Sinorhizobium meliloti]